MKKYFVLSIICLLSTISISQTNYTNFEKEAFVEIYMLIKNEAQEFNNRNDQDLLSKHKVSKSRYKEILNITLVGGRVELTAMEHIYIKEVKELNNLIETQKDISLDQRCFEKGIDTNRYKLLLKSFKSNIKTQHDLKPFFLNYILKHGK